MEAVLQKWGNSLGIRIPSGLLKELHLDNGSTVELVKKDGAIIITAKTKKATLSDMLSKITPQNLHSEEDFGAELGKEIW